uniref:GPI inositol-deacylase n=1 Tax=Pundamilia nyererei TaxID=303518 RepID=A0A3B4FZ53_9CICH
MKLAAVAFYGLAAGLLAVGLRELLTGFEENRCSMTYMFEYPEYRRVALPRRVARLYPAYGLYLYGEGVYAQETRALKLTGAPVLFLPGNAGSYKQARSLGSVALRKAETMEGGLHFNVFTVDFNEELVALYGGSLLRQTHFLHESIKAILRLYKHLKTPPQSVVLVGHSMGGVVARALFTLPRFNTNLVSLIITQASPHLAPVLALDPYLLDFYSAVRQKWVNQANKLRNVTVLSVGGGYRDYQVRSGLTSLPCPPGDPNKLSLVVTAVPRTWVSTDHLSIVWCKELVLATVRAFFDLIDPETRQFTENSEKKLAVLNHHFIKHPVRLPGETQETPVSISGLHLFFYGSWRQCNTLASKVSLYLTVFLFLFQQLLFGFLGLTSSDVTVNSSGLLHTIKLQHFHQVAFTVFSGSSQDHVPSVTEISGMLHTSRPDNTSGALLQLHTAPNCQYKVLPSSYQKEGRVFFTFVILRFCGHMVPVYTAVTLLLACGGQVSSILKSRRAADMSQMVGKGLQPHKVNLPVYILHIALSCSCFQEVWSMLFLPSMDTLPPTFPDVAFHEEETPGEEWVHLLSPLLYIFGAAVAYWGSSFKHLKLGTAVYGIPTSAYLNTDCQTVINQALSDSSPLVSFQAPRKHKEAENGTIDPECLSRSKESNGTPLLSECALQEVRDDLQLHLCLSALFTLPVMLSGPSLIHWIRNLRYSTQLNPDPCWPYIVPLIFVYMLLINCNTLKLSNSKLLPLTSCLPLPLAIIMVTFSPLHLYRITYFLLASLIPLALCCLL